jgi:hypothetical protein
MRSAHLTLLPLAHGGWQVKIFIQIQITFVNYMGCFTLRTPWILVKYTSVSVLKMTQKVDTYLR